MCSAFLKLFCFYFAVVDLACVKSGTELRFLLLPSCVNFTFQEVVPGDETLVVLAEAWRSIEQEVGALVLVDPKEDLSVFKVARVEHGLGCVRQNVTIHNRHEGKPEEGRPWKNLLGTG